MGESRKKYEKLPSYANPQPFGGHQRSGEDIVCAIRNNGNNMRETVKMIYDVRANHQQQTKCELENLSFRLKLNRSRDSIGIRPCCL